MNSLNDLWNEIIRILSEELNPTAMATWFSDCKPVEISENKIIVSTKNSFQKEIINSRFSDKIKKACSDIFACDFDVVVLVEEELDDYLTENQPEGKIPPEMAGYTFDRFIVGNSNKFAYSAAKAVSQNPGVITYNPLFIYGNSGLGKTHLLYAIAQEVNQNFQDKKIMYIKGEEFTNKMINAIRSQKIKDFRDEFRNVDLFLVDDIQFIAGKESTQEEFFNTFDSIYRAGNQIILTSDRPPREISLLEDRLKSRFEGGIIADIQPPDFETRTAIIKSKATQLGLMLSDDSIKYIATNVTANIRQIEGVIKKLTAYRNIINEVITVESVKRAIEDVMIREPEIPSPEKIIRETAKYYDLTEEDLKGQNRRQNVSEARQIAMYLIRNLTNQSLVEIGKLFEDRNHATVLSSIKKVEDNMKEDQKIRSKIRDISSNINAV